MEEYRSESVLSNTQTQAIARPLKVLVPLIKEKIETGNQAASEAGMPYYREAGEMLWEAKAQVERGRWTHWIKNNFHLSAATARDYMTLASYMQVHVIKNEQRAANRQIPDPRTLSSVTDSRPPRHAPEWYRPVMDATKGLNVERMIQERRDKDTEKALRRKLGLELINIGYKVLATKLHPDRGGSAAAMARLNQVRDTLKGAL